MWKQQHLVDHKGKHFDDENCESDPPGGVLLFLRCSISVPAIRNGMETLATGDHRPISLPQCMGTHSPCPTAVQTTQRAPTPTLEVTLTPMPPYCPTRRLVLWSRLHPWPTSWLPLSPPAPSFSPPTASPTRQASCIKSQWASTPDCCPPPPCTPRANSSLSFPRTPTLPRLPTPVSLSAPQK